MIVTVTVNMQKSTKYIPTRHSTMIIINCSDHDNSDVYDNDLDKL